MPIASLAPLDETITIAELTRDPYPIYQRLRRDAPVLRVKSVGRTFLTKAADTKYVKDNAALFSSDDPNTPMKRAFLAHTLMRKDHDEHRAERMAMMPAISSISSLRLILRDSASSFSASTASAFSFSST